MILSKLSQNMRICIFLLLWIAGAGVTLSQDKAQITAIYIDEAQNIYLGSHTGLSRMDAESRHVTGVMHGVKVTALAGSRRHGIYAACNGNEIWTSEGKQFLVLDDPEAEIRSMFLSGAQLWVGTNQGVYVISLSRQQVSTHHHMKNSLLASDMVNTMYIDGSGIKWIGTDNGVVRIEGEKKWRLYEQGTRFTAIAGSSEGTWLAGDTEMWLVDHFNRWTPTGVRDGLSKGVIRGVASDKQGRIYLLSDIFVQFNPYTDVIIPITDHGITDVSHSVALAIDAKDQLWVASAHDGLKVIDPEVEITNVPLIATFNIGHPRCAGSADGLIHIQVQGGAAPYRIVWSDPSLTGSSATGLAAGNYEVTITDNLNNRYVDAVQLISPEALRARITEDASAEGVTLEAIVSGGRGELRYLWSDGTAGSRKAISAPGQYHITVSDINGCEITASYELSEAMFAKAVPEEEEILPVPADEPLEAVTVETLKVLDAAKLNVGQILRIEQLQFPADSAHIRFESFAVLDGIYSFLLENDGIVIEIGGHTNGLPDHEYCDRLSTARARSVAEYIQSKGIPAERIYYRGYGKRAPIATNQTVEGRRKNQRVEVKILQM
jgi:outer membrane protein OmpA-like peptidoglycan-associated protein